MASPVGDERREIAVFQAACNTTRLFRKKTKYSETRCGHLERSIAFPTKFPMPLQSNYSPHL